MLPQLSLVINDMEIDYGSRVVDEHYMRERSAYFEKLNADTSYALPENADKEHDLTERFVRGEASRTTEGSGLGLSIAKNLTNLMGGTFELKLDGDLFVATISFEVLGNN